MRDFVINPLLMLQNGFVTDLICTNVLPHFVVPTITIITAQIVDTQI